jgi:hypothetical protein
MANRTGSADLPLHSGYVPPWLVTRMASLGRVIVEAVVHHYGRDERLGPCTKVHLIRSRTGIHLGSRRA